MVSTRSSAAKRPLANGDEDVSNCGCITDQSSKPVRRLPSARSVPTFEYAPLAGDQIRLLNLLPGNSGDPIFIRIQHAQLSHHPPSCRFLSQDELRDINNNLPRGWECMETLSGRLIYLNSELDTSSWSIPGFSCRRDPRREEKHDDVPPFEALSYTWGSPKSRKAIFIESSGKPLAKLLVTKNLAVALSHLRDSKSSRTLWIDAICINQEDLAERSAQVPRMRLIYQLAARVVVWLGPGSSQSDIALQTLQHLGEQVEISRTLSVIRDPDATERDWYSESHDLPFTPRAWRAIAVLVQRLWFTRIWVVQEIHLANSAAVVHCGHQTITWEVFRRAVMCLAVKRNLPPGFRGDITACHGSAHYEATEPWSGLELTVVQRDCTDPRDRVYGLLGLMPETLRARITPDYDLPVAEVYRQTLLAEIAHFGRLDGLRMCGYRPEGSGVDGPSWVPDLIRVIHYVETMRYQFSAGMSRCEPRCLSAELLEVLGTEVARVCDVSDKEDPDEDDLEVALGWIAERQAALPPDSPLPEALAMTFCGMRTRERFPDISKLPEREEWIRFLQGHVGGEVYEAGEDTYVTPFYLEFVRLLLYQRTLFSTEEGHVGLGPYDMKKGDIVVILLGYDAPMLLRENTDGTYKIIGEIMAYTLRDATGLLGPLPESWICQIFMDSVGLSTAYRFLNKESGLVSQDDPRLPPLVGWESLTSTRTADDPEVYQKFKNIETGDIINYDPRMSADTLRERGVALKQFVLS
ncbi:heterokaryon incompatibility protein-domain-containing protein [Biscogniauxia mediterranea]|nr:heterokaryon incompatibility protein-domain-containing protein [Biscogniauxia mediterranea]